VVGYEGIYEVSSFGGIRSLDSKQDAIKIRLERESEYNGIP
jgi:hypothetical protein